MATNTANQEGVPGGNPERPQAQFRQSFLNAEAFNAYRTLVRTYYQMRTEDRRQESEIYMKAIREEERLRDQDLEREHREMRELVDIILDFNRRFLATNLANQELLTQAKHAELEWLRKHKSQVFWGKARRYTLTAGICMGIVGFAWAMYILMFCIAMRWLETLTA
ncbi:hypothetical protein B0T25DRAFT_568912 [Lasiosphaeria hispida]|uniref:Uncharacterized protein n=1 Tax=Lasiosphaeria hispida TaxID=260671 RepID=A0AAJ0HJ93_9PEZI|nr:hypothetical protein B0T25DRAFT_568912 [Lasiosphaeria hispida]